MRHAWLLTSAALLCGLLASCTTPPTNEPGSAAAAGPRIELSLKTLTKDGRATYFEITRDGKLYFAGGKSAYAQSGVYVKALDTQTRQHVVDLIDQYQLLSAKSERFAKHKQVRYFVQLRVPAGSHKFVAIDQSADGLKQLHDYLFKIQADLRYNDPQLLGGVKR